MENPDEPDRDALVAEIAGSLPRRIGQAGRLIVRQARADIPRGMGSILVALHDGPERITRLAEQEGLAQPTVTRLVDRLQEQGLVVRTRDPADRRAVQVAITDAGRAAVARLRRRYHRVLTQRLQELDDDQLRALRAAGSALETLIAALHDEPGD